MTAEWNKGGRRTYGPGADADGKLNALGAGWVEQALADCGGKPIRLFRGLYPGSYRQTAEAGVPDEDTDARCAAALVRAAQKFEPERGFKFTTYAANWMRATVQRSPEVVDAERAKRNGVRFVSGETLAGNDGKTLLDLLGEEDALARESADGDERRALRAAVAGILAKQVPDFRDREIFAMRHGLYGDEPATLAEVGAVFEITKERARQLESRAKSALLPHLEELYLAHVREGS